VSTLPELRRERERVCRLDPAAALETLEDAEDFLRDRGMLTRLPDSSLPSLFGACHEEPYRPGSSGFGLWPRTKWPWAFELAERSGVHVLGIHRGKGLYVTEATAGLVDPLAREDLARIEGGSLGPEAARVADHLAAAGPSLLGELREELGIDARRLRPKLERHAGVVARAVVRDEGNTSELARWDQVFPSVPRRARRLDRRRSTGCGGSAGGRPTRLVQLAPARIAARRPRRRRSASSSRAGLGQRSGNGFPASAGTTCAVTHTGVTE
jgi:hypothetical protein